MCNWFNHAGLDAKTFHGLSPSWCVKSRWSTTSYFMKYYFKGWSTTSYFMKYALHVKCAPIDDRSRFLMTCDLRCASHHRHTNRHTNCHRPSISPRHTKSLLIHTQTFMSFLKPWKWQRACSPKQNFFSVEAPFVHFSLPLLPLDNGVQLTSETKQWTPKTSKLNYWLPLTSVASRNSTASETKNGNVAEGSQPSRGERRGYLL